MCMNMCSCFGETVHSANMCVQVEGAFWCLWMCVYQLPECVDEYDSCVCVETCVSVHQHVGVTALH